MIYDCERFDMGRKKLATGAQKIFKIKAYLGRVFHILLLCFFVGGDYSIYLQYQPANGYSLATSSFQLFVSVDRCMFISEQQPHQMRISGGFCIRGERDVDARATYLTLVLSPSHLRVYFVSDGDGLAGLVLDRIGHSWGLLMGKVFGLGGE